jgi:hypothetical protein
MRTRWAACLFQQLAWRTAEFAPPRRFSTRARSGGTRHCPMSSRRRLVSYGCYVHGGKRFQKRRFAGWIERNGTLFSPGETTGEPDVWGWIVLRCSSTGAAETVFPPATKGWMKRRRMKRPQAEAARRTFAGFEGAPGQALRQYLLGAASYQTQSKKRAHSRGRARTRAFFSAVPG